MQKKESSTWKIAHKNYPVRGAKRIKKMKKSDESPWDLWDTMKMNNVRIMGIPEGEKEKRTESIFKAIMTENFSNLGRERHIQIHKVQRTPIG